MKTYPDGPADPARRASRSGGAFFYLYKKSQAKPVVFKTETAEIADITQEDGRDRLDRAAPARSR